MPRFMITEPHPTVPQNTYTHSGRGGAGNTFKAPMTTPASGIPTPSTSSKKTTSSRFYSGRGGAGNAHAAAERVQLDFDAEYSAAARETSAGFYSGRGGAGNAYASPAVTSSDRRDSSSTNGSVRSGFFSRFSMGSR